ncbi:hypothetical protein [Calothrix sp. 336/3]|uniref:hypothetical protein n=1 Tax=Calothrix sp. 336/3 TaxID=1337936 RepID=UPI0004E36434|nr:hypothetical protein [Calothrix sp. 336/3]AKG21482.1 hypothetical protein IJ00_09470 [Calothrix sp. 336/3]
MEENNQTSITVEVPTPAQPVYPVQKRDKLAEIKYQLLDRLLPSPHWEDNALVVISYISAPMFAVSVIRRVNVPLPIIGVILAICIAIVGAVAWVWKYVPEAAVWVNIRVGLIWLGLFLGGIL